MLTWDNLALYHRNISEKSSQIYSRNLFSEQLSGYAKKYLKRTDRICLTGGKDENETYKSDKNRYLAYSGNASVYLGSGNGIRCII